MLNAPFLLKRLLRFSARGRISASESKVESATGMPNCAMGTWSRCGRQATRIVGEMVVAGVDGKVAIGRVRLIDGRIYSRSGNSGDRSSRAE